MNSDKMGLNQTEFHKENISSQKTTGTVRLENTISNIQVKLEILDQINSKLTSLKKDVTEIYTKVDEIEDAGMAAARSGGRASRSSLDRRSDLPDPQINEIHRSIRAIEDKLILVNDIREQVNRLSDVNERAILQGGSGISERVLREQLEASFAQMKTVGVELDGIQEIAEKMKSLDSFEEKLPVLDQIAERLKKLDQFVNLKSVLETIGERLKKIDSVDKKITNIYDKLQTIDQIDEKLSALENINKKLAKLESISLGLQAGHVLKEAVKPMTAKAAKTAKATKDTQDTGGSEKLKEAGIKEEFEEEVIPEGIEDEFEEDVIPEGIEDEFEEGEGSQGMAAGISEGTTQGNTGFLVSEDLSEEDKTLIEEINDKLEKLDEISAKLEILEEFGERLEMLEDMDEQINYIRDFMDDKLDLDYIAMYETLREEVHEDAIKTYRNIQAVIVEENAKQNHVLFGVDGNQDKLKFRMNHVMFFSIISFVTSILVMLLQILPALGIDLF